MRNQQIEKSYRITPQGRARLSDFKKPLLRRCKNRPEQQFIRSAQNKGWTVIRRGWPDYMCFKLNESGEISQVMAVEVKPRHAEGLKFHQLLSASILTKAGINCFVYGAEEKSLKKITGIVQK